MHRSPENKLPSPTELIDTVRSIVKEQVGGWDPLQGTLVIDCQAVFVSRVFRPNNL